MLDEIMNYLNNYFLIDGALKVGTFEIKNGQADLPFLQKGQYYLIAGSVFNDGIHQYGYGDLHDERFHGDIAPMAVPDTFIALAAEITEWQAKAGQEALKPYQSESFAGYSYSKATGRNGGAYTWKDAFASRLNAWRKI